MLCCRWLQAQVSMHLVGVHHAASSDSVLSCFWFCRLWGSLQKVTSLATCEQRLSWRWLVSSRSEQWLSLVHSRNAGHSLFKAVHVVPSLKKCICTGVCSPHYCFADQPGACSCFLKYLWSSETAICLSFMFTIAMTGFCWPTKTCTWLCKCICKPTAVWLDTALLSRSTLQLDQAIIARMTCLHTDHFVSATAKALYSTYMHFSASKIQQ